MGANCDYTFIADTRDLAVAWDRAGGNANVDYAEGYSGSIAECGRPWSARNWTDSDSIAKVWDLLGKNECKAFYKDGGILFVFIARE